MEVKLLDLQGQYLPIRHEIRRAIDEVCDAQALILGPHVEKFEKHLADYCQTTHAIGMSSGTDALLCALMGIGIKPGDEVICPSFTFFATAGSIARLGAIRVFAEIDPATGGVVSSPATGASALLDKWTVTKPEVTSFLSATLSAPESIAAGGGLTYVVHLKNHSQYSLNGTQVRLSLHDGLSFAGTLGQTTTVQGNEVVVTIGRLAAGSTQDISIPTLASPNSGRRIEGRATVTSSTALPVSTNGVTTSVSH